MKQLRNNLLLILSLICGGITFAADKLPAPKASSEPIDSIVAVVNTRVITQNELDHAVKITTSELKQRGIALPDQNTLEQKTLQSLIDKNLQLIIAEQNHISIDQKKVDEAIAQIAKRNQMTVTELKQKLQQDGISFAEFTQQTRDQMTLMTLQRQALAGKVRLTTQEVAAFKTKLEKENETTRYHVVDYLLVDADQEKAQQLMKDLENKKDVSQMPGVEVQQLGWRELDSIPDAFATHVVNMRDNSVAGPIVTSNGYHVIKLLGTRQESHPVSDNEAKQRLYGRKFQQALKDWLQELRTSAYIKTYLSS